MNPIISEPKYLAFKNDELLYRRIAKEDIDKITNKLKPTKLRPQFSTYRSLLLENIEAIKLDKWNGIAAIKVGAARNISSKYINVRCIWEPTKADISHTLIALEPNIEYGICLEADYTDICIKLINNFSIAVLPT